MCLSCSSQSLTLIRGRFCLTNTLTQRAWMNSKEASWSRDNPLFKLIFDRLLAELMIPDGVHDQSEDWTIFFLNQTPFNTIAPVLALDTPGVRTSRIEEDEDGNPELLYVLNLVRTKLDKTVRRCVACLLKSKRN